MEALKAKAMQALIFLRVVDAHDLTISLTNLGLIVVLVKLALVKQASMTDLGAMFLSLLAYQTKRMTNPNSLKTASDLVESGKKIVSQISNIEKSINTAKEQE